MKTFIVYAVCAFAGASALIFVASADWLLAGAIGAGIGLGAALFVHAFPRDLAPPSERRRRSAKARDAKASDRF